MTGPATVLENAASRRLPLWPGLLLNVVLPGSGFSYLGRPWLHLLTLLVTLLTWFAAWLLVLYVGYAGWSPGQLADERRRGSWITAPSAPETVFSTPPAALWQTLLRRKGGRFKALSNYPADPRLN